jgi:hypothetical protein
MSRSFRLLKNATACMQAQGDGHQVDNVKQDGRFTDNHLGRSTGLIVGGYSAMFVAPSF